MNPRILPVSRRTWQVGLLVLAAVSGCESAPRPTPRSAVLNEIDARVVELRAYFAGLHAGYPLTQVQADLGLRDPDNVTPPNEPKGTYSVRYFFRGTVILLQATGAANAEFLSSLSFAGAPPVVITEKRYWDTLARVAENKDNDAANRR